MAVFQFFIPNGSIPGMAVDGFDVKISEDKRNISISLEAEPEVMLDLQLGKLSTSQKAHLAIMIAVLRHGGRLAIDGEVFNTKFKDVDPDFPGITTI